VGTRIGKNYIPREEAIQKGSSMVEMKSWGSCGETRDETLPLLKSISIKLNILKTVNYPFQGPISGHGRCHQTSS
jgi:hypothetical protein